MNEAASAILCDLVRAGGVGVPIARLVAARVCTRHQALSVARASVSRSLRRLQKRGAVVLLTAGWIDLAAIRNAQAKMLADVLADPVRALADEQAAWRRSAPGMPLPGMTAAEFVTARRHDWQRQQRRRWRAHYVSLTAKGRQMMGFQRCV